LESALAARGGGTNAFQDGGEAVHGIPGFRMDGSQK
jgi:hypothetical protein